MNIKFLITIVLLFCSSSLNSQTFLDSTEVNKMNHIIIEYESNKKRIDILDSIISELKEQKKDQEKISAQKDTIIEKYKHNEATYQKAIKRRDNIIKFGSGILIILGIIKLLL